MTAHARTTDPETSHEAAASVENVRLSQWRVYLILTGSGPATDQELISRAAQCGWLTSESGLRTRRSELVRLGMVEDSGITRLTDAGRRTIVWQVVR